MLQILDCSLMCCLDWGLCLLAYAACQVRGAKSCCGHRCWLPRVSTVFVPNVLCLYILQNGFLCLPHFVKCLLGDTLLPAAEDSALGSRTCQNSSNDVRFSNMVRHVAGGFLKNLLFCTLAKAGRQASFDCSTTLIHHNSCWLCTREHISDLC